MSYVIAANDFISKHPQSTVAEVYTSVMGQPFPRKGTEARREATAKVHLWLTQIRKSLQGSNVALHGTWRYDAKGNRIAKQYQIGNKWTATAQAKGSHGRASVEALITDNSTRIANMYQPVIAAKATSQSPATAAELDKLDKCIKALVRQAKVAESLLALDAAFAAIPRT